LIIGLAEGRNPPLVLHAFTGAIDDQDLYELERLRSELDALGLAAARSSFRHR
jgi:hypothetical protein